MIRIRRPGRAAAMAPLPATGGENSQPLNGAGLAGAPEPQQPAAPRSRRAMMTGTMAAGAGVATALVLRAQPAQAADNGTLTLGEANSASQATTLTNDGADNTTYDGLDVSSAQGNGVQGTTSANKLSGLAGVDNSSGGGTGVSGTSTAGTGVTGTSENGYGVNGTSQNSVGVFGSSLNTFGVEGSSTNASGVMGTTTGTAQGGVLGLDNCPTGANGVIGNSDVGTGVFGTSNSGAGVKGTSGSGTGLSGTSTSGTGVSGVSTNSSGVTGSSPTGVGVLAASPSGTALVVEGRARFSRSGVAFIQPGLRSVTVTLPGVGSGSFIIATLQQTQTTIFGVPILLVSAIPGSGAFTISVTAPPRGALAVAWMAFDQALS